MGLLRKRKPVEEVVQNPATSPATREKLLFTQEVIKYAKAEELNVEDSYTQFIELDGQAVSYLVQAAKPNEFALKTWWFPFVGTVPYLGFFAKDDRDEYAKHLVAEGYEVHLGTASAFSSLGWFSDPIYSSMLADDDTELAHLYFHELTHKTAWIPGSVEFNENFAEFIGEAMTEQFFKDTGREAELTAFYVKRRDLHKFKIWLKQLKAQLELYFVDLKDKNGEDVVRGKSDLIERAVSAKPSFEQFDFVGKRPWNTPRILGASLYSPDTAIFRRAYDCAGVRKFGAFARMVKERLQKSDQPEQVLTKFCGS